MLFFIFCALIFSFVNSKRCFGGCVDCSFDKFDQDFPQLFLGCDEYYFNSSVISVAGATVSVVGATYDIYPNIEGNVTADQIKWCQDQRKNFTTILVAKLNEIPTNLKNETGNSFYSPDIYISAHSWSGVQDIFSKLLVDAHYGTTFRSKSAGDVVHVLMKYVNSYDGNTLTPQCKMTYAFYLCWLSDKWATIWGVSIGMIVLIVFFCICSIGIVLLLALMKCLFLKKKEEPTN